jgi:two-component system sensor histidine kinase PilS (NtrC family)
MLVYSRRNNQGARPMWVIGTRAVTFAVTAALAWPHLATSIWLNWALPVYGSFTVLAILSLLFLKGVRFRKLVSTALTLQIAMELIVISMVVHFTGGMRSPYNSLYLMTIISAALSYRLVGTLLIAASASSSFFLVVWIEAGRQATTMWSWEVWSALRHMPDEDFYTIFLRLCIFFLCAFAGGYLAERLYSKDEALAHTSEALQMAKLETGDILKHLRSGVLTVDLAGFIVYFNRAAEEILGLSEKRVRGRSIREGIGSNYPELADRLDWVVATQQMDSRTELTICREDGKSLPVGISTSILSGGNGKPRGVIAVFADLTEVKQIEERLRRQDRLAAIGELSAGIAHEIRNPLAAISGSVEVLRNDLDVSGENAQLLNLIVKESSRLNKILSDFLLYARMSPVVTGRVCVATVLDEVFEITKRHYLQSGVRNIDLRAEVADRTMMVEADPDHLKQILINLVFNAVEACHENERKIVARVRSHTVSRTDEVDGFLRIGEWASIAVCDSGEGIPQRIRERLYEPFVSAKPSGTGLGLAVVKRLVDNCGGRITVDTQEGKGTTFTVYLHRCPVDAPIPTRAYV